MMDEIGAWNQFRSAEKRGLTTRREGYGSDPYLHGISAYWAVKGIQSNGVIATPK